MTILIISAMEKLVAILKRENGALSLGRIPEALSLTSDKQTAAVELEKAIEAASIQDMCVFADTSISPEHRTLLETMLDLSKQNGELLQRAIKTQKRLIELLTDPLPSEAPQSYGSLGSYAEGASKRQALFVSRA
ncbi:flagellar protein FlgN [Gluconobacter frateurii]|uniref:flagellar protein FlgN n=1 Tax=Gluconobacter frateurii TaxID=38308 RepID=UPI001F0514E6|nr:flagellar protein FlgN [Gluconobacter frateurii]UMM09849.1 flagellar protein FlgN [Gluconobacter frateurii]